MKYYVKVVAMMLSVMLLLSVFSACTVSQKSYLTLVENGQSDYKIIIAESSGTPVRNAASELQKYIAQITGKMLEIKSDSAPETECEIIVGYTSRGDFGVDAEKLADDGYAIKVSGKKLIIAGGKRGAIYGVYGFLRDELGCGFYSPDCEYVPSTQTVKVFDDLNRTDAPFFSQRSSYIEFYTETSDSAAMKLGMEPESEDWGATKLIHAPTKMTMHTINYLLAGEENPKLHTYNQQPCVSSDENYNKILTHALAWIQQQINTYGHCDILDVTQNDGPGGWCECERCTELNNLYAGGKPSGSWWAFINRIAGDVHAQYPNIEIRTYAYEDTRPPVSLEIADGVSAYVATGNGSACVNHGYNECEVNTNTDFETALNNWTPKLENVYIYEYLGCPSEFNMTDPNLYAMRTNYRFFADHNADSVICFGTAAKVADLVALRYYLMCRLTWNPYISAAEYNEMMLDFCTHYYGEESGALIKEFVDLVMTTYANEHIEIVYGYKISKEFPVKRRNPVTFPEITDEIKNNPDYDWRQVFQLQHFADTTYVDAANSLFDRAEAAAETAEQLSRIKLAHIQVHYYELLMYDALGSVITPWARTLRNNNGLAADTASSAVAVERYKQLNEQLWQEMKDCGVSMLKEGMDLPENPNFEYNPADWNK